MSRVIFYKQFSKFYSVLISLADKKGFEEYFKGLKSNLENCTISADFSKIEYHEFNYDTGEFVEHSYEIDKAIYADTKQFTRSPIGKILPHFRNKTSLKKCIGDLNIALKGLEENDFYDRFPLYKTILEELKTVLLTRLNTRESSSEYPNGNSEGKTTKGELSAQLEWIYEIIQSKNEESEAVKEIKKKLRDDFPSVNIDPISWYKEKLYHMTSGNLNATGCSRLMKEISDQLFGEDIAPGDQLIRTMYFKND